VRPAVAPSAPPLRLHRGGGFRRRLAAVFGRDEAAGDVLWRRLIHATGALVLVYYLLPDRFFVVLPKVDILLLALAAAAGLEVLRLGFGAELPTIRGYEARRPASYLYYAVALVAAIALFPEPIAVAVILGTAFVDPLAGAFRGLEGARRSGPVVAGAVYAALAATAFAVVGRWPWADVAALALLGAAVAVPVERWRFRWLDDDLTMTVVPALVLLGAVAALGLPR
jgi:dolichol kinase